MKKPSLFGLVVGFAIASQAAAQFGGGPAKLELVKVKDDIYVIHNEAVPGNVTALVTNEGVLLVDDKFDVDHDNIMAMLKTVTNQPVKYVINTHYHGDHSGGNAKLQAAGTLAVASAQARARMVSGNQPGLPNITIEPRGTIHLGGKVAEMYWLGRGHTDGDIVVLFPEHRVLATGDLYANGPGTSAQLVDYNGGGSAKAWTGTVDDMLKLPFDTAIPGHGNVVAKPELQAFRERSQRMTDLISQMVDQGKSKADIEATMRSEFAWEDFHIQAALDGLINEMR